ncbi:MAG: RICIN domain-containing protein [Chitinophagaceae bacterium]|nr:RICIN domain-containing protein [Oligoflexus sp.]
MLAIAKAVHSALMLRAGVEIAALKLSCGTNQDNQVWIFREVEHGAYEIKSRLGTCLDAPKGKSVNEGIYQTEDCNNSWTQQFWVYRNLNGTIQIANRSGAAQMLTSFENEFNSPPQGDVHQGLSDSSARFNLMLR